MNENRPKALSPLKWTLGVLGLVGVMVVCGGLPWLFMTPPATAPMLPVGLSAVVFGALGVVLFALAALVYGLVLLTSCLTFSMSGPFFGRYKLRFWVANLIVGLLVQLGVAFIAMPYLGLVLGRFLPPQISFFAALGIPYVVMQIVLIWLNIWVPLERMTIRRRLVARGMAPDQLAGGRYVGVSDPSRSSFKKFPMVEDDVGMMWLEFGRALYYGDSQAWEFTPEQLLAVERRADAGATSSYFGAVQVVLRIADASGVERSVRIHPEGDWTMTAKARALDAIAERLSAWKEHPAPGWLQAPAGFTVVTPPST